MWTTDSGDPWLRLTFGMLYTVQVVMVLGFLTQETVVHVCAVGMATLWRSSKNIAKN